MIFDWKSSACELYLAPRRITPSPRTTIILKLFTMAKTELGPQAKRLRTIIISLPILVATSG
jgi:hypothetical protein